MKRTGVTGYVHFSLVAWGKEALTGTGAVKGSGARWSLWVDAVLVGVDDFFDEVAEAARGVVIA